MRLNQDLFCGVRPRLTITESLTVDEALGISEILEGREDLYDFVTMLEALNVALCAQDRDVRNVARKTYIDFKEGWRERDPEKQDGDMQYLATMLEMTRNEYNISLRPEYERGKYESHL